MGILSAQTLDAGRRGAIFLRGPEKEARRAPETRTKGVPIGTRGQLAGGVDFARACGQMTCWLHLSADVLTHVRDTVSFDYSTTYEILTSTVLTCSNPKETAYLT